MTRTSRPFHSATLPILLMLGVLMQLPPLFGGLELCDSGFYLTFYDNFFSAPRSVEYNFMYYLSGLAGASFMKLFPDSMLAMRLFGLLCNLGCICCIWRLFRDRPVALAGAVALQLAGSWLSPLTFYYDTLTALLLCLSILALRLGINPGAPRRLLFVAGLLAGLNLFSRIPNVLEISLLLLIPISTRILYGRAAWRPALRFVAGWITGILAVLTVMVSLGHLHIFIDNMRDLFGIAASEGGEASHGLGNLIAAQFRAWGRFLPLMLKLVGLLALWRIIIRFNVPAWLRRSAAVALTAAAIFLCVRVDTFTALLAITFPGLLLGIFETSDRDLHVLCWIGLLTMLVVPLGSDGGIYNQCIYATWLGVPAALAALPPVLSQKKENSVQDSTSTRENISGNLITGCIVGAVVVAGATRMVSGGLYFDSTPLFEMTCAAHVPRAAHVRTSAERAERLDGIVAELRRHVSPGDTLLVYGSAPTLNYLTATRPAFGNSWPEQLSADMLDARLRSEPRIPYVLLMKFNAIGNKWGEPSREYVEGRANANIYHTERKSRLMLDYLRRRAYRPVADTPDFTLYAPSR